MLEIPGVQASHALTYEVASKKLFNHVWPWIEYTKGLELNVKPKRVKRKASDAGRYKSVKKQRVKLTKLKRVQSSRAELVKTCENN